MIKIYQKNYRLVFSSSAIEGMELDSSEMNSDIHASGEFRASLVVTYAKKAVEAC